MQSVNEKVQLQLNADPFIKLWEKNYNQNLSSGNLGSFRTKPLMYLHNMRPYQRVPVVLIVAGPSLDKNIEQLKAYQKNCLIICADVVLFKLLEHDIKPDFVVNIDPHESIGRFWSHLETSDLYLACPTTTNPATFENWKGRMFLFNQKDVDRSPKGDALKRITKTTAGWGNIFNQYFIGATMLQFSTLFLPSHVILVGYDFAYTDGKAYCDGFLDLKIYHLEDPVGSENHTKMVEWLKSQEIKKEVEIKTGVTTSVWTTRQLKFYKDSFVKLIKKMRCPVVNSTEGGILLEVSKMPLKDSMDRYCKTPIEKKNIWENSRHKRRRKKKR